jgi:hypothetical protein
MDLMTTLERESYRSFHGPAPTDEDAWRLVFDHAEMRLTVRHEWQTTRHGGKDEFTIDEFLAQRGDPQEALIALLFERSDAQAPKREGKKIGT